MGSVSCLHQTLLRYAHVLLSTEVLIDNSPLFYSSIPLKPLPRHSSDFVHGTILYSACFVVSGAGRTTVLECDS